jgi:Na+-translocating ferredoxin:NAD+ oxidoreductase RnfD subunit
MAAVIVDMGITWVLRRAWLFPSGALLTGLIIGMILSPQKPWYVPIATAIVGTISKHLIKIGRKPVFNPAALGLLVAAFLFASGQSWWGAVSALSPWWIGVLLVVGFLITDRVNKFPQVLAFLGAYFFLFTVAALMGNTSQVAEIFKVPFVNTVLFFAFIMLTDPPTSPNSLEEQLQFGGLVALTSFLVYLFFGSLTYLLVALLLGNALVAWGRVSATSSVDQGEEENISPSEQSSSTPYLSR